MTTYGMLIFDGADELNFTGPWEVFNVSSILRDDADTSVLIAQNRDVVSCQKGMKVVPSHTLEDHPPLDVLVVPGGSGTLQQLQNPVVTEWIRKTAPSTAWTSSVCTGAFLLREAGPARGRRMATHHAYLEKLRAFGDVTVVPDARYVVDGNVISTQGITAGIDMALWVVGQLHGREHARAVQWRLQYYPAPPYQADEPQ
ncbi:DJ-1/PfpI family protein [Streptomyces sp. NPDC001093]|uniref:DJ-1/PfpI family protein n=1 Tax=Streptomyces sp. NPDC001093 TaxID=3154376 RepID=UPI00331BE2BC